MTDAWKPAEDCNCDRENTRDPQDMSQYREWFCSGCGIKANLKSEPIEGLVALVCPRCGKDLAPLNPVGWDAYGTVILFQRGWEGCHNPKGTG